MNSPLRSRRPLRRCRRRGAVAVEFAILVSLFILISLAIVEFGRAMQVHQVVTNAAREAARRAIVPGATDEEVQDAVDRYMAAAGIEGHDVTLAVNGNEASLAGAISHDALSVTVAVPYSQVRWVMTSFIAGEANMSATVTTRKE